MKGFFKKVLIINLDERRYYTEDIPDEVYRNFLGGKGLGIYLMLKGTGLSLMLFLLIIIS